MSKKYNLEFKLQLIKEYKADPLGYKGLLKKYNIHYSYIQKWVHLYNTFGIKGLTSGMTRKKYTQKEKIEILEYRLKHQLSYKETAKNLILSTQVILRSGRRNIMNMVFLA